MQKQKIHKRIVIVDVSHVLSKAANREDRINQHVYKNYMRQLTANEVDHSSFDMDHRNEGRGQWMINHD